MAGPHFHLTVVPLILESIQTAKSNTGTGDTVAKGRGMPQPQQVQLEEKGIWKKPLKWASELWLVPGFLDDLRQMA